LRTAIASGGIFTYTYHKMSRVESWLPPGAGSQPMALLLIELDSQAITTELNYTATLRANCSAPFQASGTQYFQKKLILMFRLVNGDLITSLS